MSPRTSGGPASRIAILLFAFLLLPLGARASQLVYVGPVDQAGTGLGHVATVLSIGDREVESGCVAWDGAKDVFGPGAPACPTGFTGGDEKRGASQTLTRTLAEIGNPTASSLRVIFNASEPGSDRRLRLEALVLRVFDHTGRVLLEAALQAPMDVDATDSGIGKAGWAFGLSDPAGAASAFTSGINRIGLAATVSGADGGFETFYLAQAEGVGSGEGPGDNENVPDQADLGLTADGTGECPRAQFVARVVNEGPETAANVVVQFQPPAGAVLVSATASPGACTSGPPVRCTIGWLAPGANATVVVVVRAQGSAAASLTGEFSVSSSTGDSDPGDNVAAATVTVDADCDQIAGGDNCPSVPNPDQSDSDGDGVGDACEEERDGDLVSDLTDNCPGTPNADQLDTDSDGIGDACDSCPAASNPAQLDRDRDGLGDVCDSPAVAPAPCPGGDCRISVRPAATLLFPWFGVDLGEPDGLNTSLAITNVDARSHLVSVTLWTDWAIPTLTFNVHLTGFDVQRLDLRELFAGALPATGAGTSPTGPLSAAGAAFPGCSDPVADPAVSSAFLGRAHTGRKARGVCFASPREGQLATGYVTVDVVRSCSALDPSSPGYFVHGGQGVAGNENVLLGEYAYVDLGRGLAQGEQAVHIAADPVAFGSGYTFYGRYVGGDGSDNRQPLGSTFSASFAQSEAAGRETLLAVWRDTKSAAAGPVACGALPSWAPLSTGEQPVWDEEEGLEMLPSSTASFPWATQAVAVGSDELPIADDYGWTVLDLGHRADLFGLAAQGWVTVLKSDALGGTAHDAAVLQSACEIP